MVSGATRGIGRAIALELAAEGANISFNFLKSAPAAEALEKEIKNLGAKAKSFQVDIKDYAAVKKWVDETKELFGGLDIVVNNAGIIRDKALALMELEDWHEVIATNLDGTFKPYLGHTLGASALLETAILLLSLQQNTIPPALNYQNPDPKFNISLVTEQLKKPLKTAMKTCCAFAGYNAAAVFHKL